MKYYAFFDSTGICKAINSSLTDAYVEDSTYVSEVPPGTLPSDVFLLNKQVISTTPMPVTYPSELPKAVGKEVFTLPEHTFAIIEGVHYSFKFNINTSVVNRYHVEFIGKHVGSTVISVVDYAEKRKVEYPPITEQLDAIWKGGTDELQMREQILSIKEKYPKTG